MGERLEIEIPPQLTEPLLQYLRDAVYHLGVSAADQNESDKPCILKRKTCIFVGKIIIIRHLTFTSKP